MRSVNPFLEVLISIPGRPDRVRRVLGKVMPVVIEVASRDVDGRFSHFVIEVSFLIMESDDITEKC